MKAVLGLALGVLTAIGGFVDIGDLVTSSVVGSRFGLTLVWVIVVGVVGICLFAQMSGRVAAASARARPTSWRSAVSGGTPMTSTASTASSAITSPRELRSGTTLCSVQICVPSRRTMRNCNERTPSTPSCPSVRTSSMSSLWVTLMINDGSS